jgi:hypothetical protein
VAILRAENEPRYIEPCEQQRSPEILASKSPHGQERYGHLPSLKYIERTTGGRGQDSTVSLHSHASKTILEDIIH